MIVQAFPSGPYLTNSYVIGCSNTHEAAIVDAAPESTNKILAFLRDRQLKPKILLLTHSHWDHIADAAVLKKGCGVPIYVHSLDAPNLEKPGADGLPFRMAIEGIQPDKLIEEGDSVQIGNYTFKVIHTPGHSAGSVCFYCEQENLLFSGDTIFRGAIGNTSFPTSRPDLMRHSLAKLGKLPSQTKVLPGHGPSTTIGAEAN